MKEGFADITTLHVKDFVYGPSTNTTSMTFITSMTAFAAASTTITYTKQTMYFNRGVIVNLSTVTTTSISST
jgi:hypothetical protein